MLFSIILSCSNDDNLQFREDSTSLFNDIQSHSSERDREASPSIIPSEWDGYNDPSLVLGNDYISNFNQLPLSANLDKEPWSGYYWAENKGGIAYRWKTDQTFDFHIYSKEEIMDAPLDKIEELSPAEKYDLLVGNYDWPLTQRSLASSSPTESSWTGYCHGWAPASIDFEEPHPIILENEDGIKIPFGSSDIKALLTYFRADVLTDKTIYDAWSVENKVLGGACGSAIAIDAACYDTNPASFHIILGNMLGHRGEAFIMDVDSTYEKWNQPVFAYDSWIRTEREPNEYASSRAIKEYIIQTTVTWTMEIEPKYTPVLHTSSQNVEERNYLYSIEVDDHHNIIGGQWMTETENNSFIPLPRAWEYLMEFDENGDGRPDFTKHTASEKIWNYFSIPDYIWIQRNASFPEHFYDVHSKYSLIATTFSTRRDLYYYLGELEGLYNQSIE